MIHERKWSFQKFMMAYVVFIFTLPLTLDADTKYIKDGITMVLGSGSN